MKNICLVNWNLAKIWAMYNQNNLFKAISCHHSYTIACESCLKNELFWRPPDFIEIWTKLIKSIFFTMPNNINSWFDRVSILNLYVHIDQRKFFILKGLQRKNSKNWVRSQILPFTRLPACTVDLRAKPMCEKHSQNAQWRDRMTKWKCS